jgi:RHS repeat-associated protein
LYTNSSGADVGEQGTYPFGESWYNNSTTSSWVFTTYERDPESGNDYALARSYASTNGRFLSPDLLEGIVGDPQSWNRYAYVENDPINLSDPSGQGFWEDLGFAIADVFLTLIPGGQAVLPYALGVEAGAEAGNVAVTLDDGTQVVGPWGGSAAGHVGERVWALSRNGPWYPYDEAPNATCGDCAGIGTGSPSDGVGNGAGSQSPGSSGSGGGSDTVANDIWHEGPNCQGCGVIWSNANSSVYQFMRYQLYDVAGGLAVAGVARVAGAVREGIYEFTAHTGETYVGQSGNIAARLQQHIASGKLLPQNLGTVRITEVLGGRLAREVAEQLRIDELGGIGKLANLRNPIRNGAARLLNALMMEF